MVLTNRKKTCLLSRSPKPCSYLFHVWSKSTELSTLRWMTVEPPSIEMIRNIFQVMFLFYTSRTKSSGSVIITDNVNRISTPLSAPLDTLFLWLSILIRFCVLFHVQWPLVRASKYRQCFNALLESILL